MSEMFSSFVGDIDFTWQRMIGHPVSTVTCRSRCPGKGRQRSAPTFSRRTARMPCGQEPLMLYCQLSNERSMRFKLSLGSVLNSAAGGLAKLQSTI